MKRRAHLSWPALALSLSALGLAACNGGDGPRPPASVSPVGGVTLAGTVGELLSEPISVRVADNGGAPLGGQIVTFAVDGGGTVTPAVDTTDNTGTASTRWRLGEAAGAQRLTATVAGVATSATFTATATAGAPSSVAISAGNNQNAVAGAAVGTPPAVVVRDRFNNPVAGTSVFFTVAAGGGSVSGAGATTNAQGVAAVGSWTLGPAVGANRLTALVLSNGVASNPLTFTATATAGAAASVVATGTTSLTGTVGALLTPIPTVRVLDANGNPVAGAAVSFVASAGSNVAGGTKNTDANGNASPDGWQLGTTAQNYTLTATAGTLPPVVFTAAARAAVASQVAISAGNNQSVPVGRPVPIEPAVRVSDSFGNPVAGLEVLFEVVSGGGSAVTRRPVTNALGIATVGGWTLGDDIGANSLRATVQAQGITGNPVLFSATATAGAPATVVVNAGNNQAAIAGTAVAIAPSVVVRDNRGNPVPGVAVSFLIGSGGGSLTGGTATTNAVGVATVGSWTLGGTAGAQTLIARVANLPDFTFTATATAGAAANLTAQTSTSLGTIVVASNQAAPTLPSVRVTDALGNPVAGVTVTFTLGNNASGTITGGTQTTNANGVATLGSWTLPTVAGTASVVATIPNVTGVTFTANMAAAAANRRVLVSSTAPTTNAVARTSYQVVFRVQDAFGNNVLVQGVSIGLSAAASGGTTPVAGTISSANPAATDASGLITVTWVTGTGTGSTQTLTATSAGLLSASATAVLQ
ncbi:MAG: beta strand repeat-containing protein [Gemmatimonas sp.]|uniref:beta strand repeat-containing protein n=1 Tax=Gemmatimonas sp. TaxID=1962908 RepID=UPI00391F8975